MKQKRGTKRTDKPRISVYRSNQYIYAQLIDDATGTTIVSASDKRIATPKKTDKKSPKCARAYAVGEALAQQAVKKNITTVWFDRGRYRYHGRIQALAEGARAGGLQF